MNYYAVKVGHTIGVFTDWNECLESTKGYSGADYKKFPTFEDAEAYINDIDLFDEKIKEDISNGYIVAFCDGSFDKKRERYAYGVLIIDNNLQEHEICGSSKNAKYISTQNIIGEVLGVINAMDWAVSNNYEKVKIYHDYEGLSKWITGEWKVKSNVAEMFVSLYNNKFSDLLQVEFEKVKGHSNNKYNDKADELAKRALAENSRVPITGNNWFSISYFKAEDLQMIMDLISEEHSEISIEKKVTPNSVCHKLLLSKDKLSVTQFNGGARKLLVQGSESILFQIFITYVNELIGVKGDYVFADAYRKNIDAKKIDTGINTIFPEFPLDYPDSVKRLIRQAIINLNYFIESEDYSQYVFPALRTLETHMKYLFSKVGITITKKNGFNYFDKCQTTNRYYLPSSIISDLEIKEKLENSYNFYNETRHTLFHTGDIMGMFDDTRIIEDKREADNLIKKCLSYINQ